ncbi:uncharacterized protein LOC119162989 isoform X2 [Rhipicephalus microplus]|uniref:uncharacterized protein LOC119162989 isoform X2 n=1 Tax=Rhipicephalus microplus TaxID=6941 RepID=UPI003F6C104B
METRVWNDPRNITSFLTMPSYRKPPVNNEYCIGGEEQKAGASKGPQRSGISEPFHPVPGCRSLGEWHPLQQPKKDVPLNPPLRRPKEDLPLNRPPGQPNDVPLNPPLRRPKEDLPLNRPLGQSKDVPLNPPLRRPKEDLPLNCPLGQPKDVPLNPSSRRSKEDLPLNPPQRRPKEDLPLNHPLRQPKVVPLNPSLRRPNEDLPLNRPPGQPKDVPLSPLLRRPKENLPLYSPLGQPKDVPLNPSLRRPKEDLPLNPPPLLETTTPLELFQDAFAVLNDFCGNLCTKIPCGHKHKYPFYKRAVCNTEDLIMTFETVVRVTDHMDFVVKMFGCSRDDMVDFAEALIVTLIKILEKLRHEAIPKKKTWRVELNDMVDFLMDPNNSVPAVQSSPAPAIAQRDSVPPNVPPPVPVIQDHSSGLQEGSPGCSSPSVDAPNSNIGTGDAGNGSSESEVANCLQYSYRRPVHVHAVH